MVKTYVAASRKQPEENIHVEIIIKAKCDAKVVEEEIKKTALNLSRKMHKKLTYEIISVIRNDF